jgi:hypothetical protein
MREDGLPTGTWVARGSLNAWYADTKPDNERTLEQLP